MPTKGTAAPKDPTMVWSPRRLLRGETDLCPKVPTDLALAHKEAVMEELGIYDEYDDVMRQQTEDEEWYAEYLDDIDYAAEMDAMWREDALADTADYGDDEPSGWRADYRDDPDGWWDYDDLEYEAMRRDPMTGSTYEDWHS
jgi:hypothetical protein